MRKKDKETLDKGLGIENPDSNKDILEGEVLTTNMENITKTSNDNITTPPMILNQSNIVHEFDVEDEQADYNLNRKTLRNILVKGEDALEDMMALAKDDETPRAYEVLGGLMKSLAEISGNLLDVHEKRKRIRAPSKNSVPEENKTPMNIQGDNTTVFVGTPSDILKQLKGRGKPDNNV